MAAMTTPICDFGWKAKGFDLLGVNGSNYSLADVSGVNGTLVMFLCNHCPFVKAVIGRIVRDVSELAGHGIGAVAIMPNDVASHPSDSFDNMKLFAAAHDFSFPYVIDESQAVARAYEAVCTPDFFGFDASGGLQYRGRLDESRLEPVAGARRDLFEAMKHVAGSGAGPEQQLPSLGCSIKWRAAA